MPYSTQKLRQLRAAIGRNIHAARVERKVLLHELAAESGVPAEMLDRYELGKNEIRLDELFRIACALDKGIGALVEERR